MERDEFKKEGRSTNPFSVPEKFKQATSPFHIDGYDSTMLEDRAYLKLDDEMLKLEYRINQLEEDLMIINDEILAAINIDDHSRTEFLQTKRENIKKELERLNNKYFDIGVMSKFTTIISNIFRKKSSKEKTLLQKINYFIEKYVFATLSKRLNFTFNLKESMSKLSDINRSVDELISLRIPFGGLTGRYEKLTNYINKANDIHAMIAKNVNEFEKRVEAPVKKTDGIGGLLDVSQ
ncbi:hypothetical protein IJ843_02690 [bacterium]|nr:hypothetical protein [bacterium]